MADDRQAQSEKAAKTLREAFEELGLDARTDPELKRTPENFAGLLQDLFCGLWETPPEISVTETKSEEMVLLKDMPFHSVCAHHLLPFFGRACIAYVPDGNLLGLGVLPRALKHFAARPQLQERLAEQVADFLQERALPKGVAVWLEARQMCVEMRGAQSPCHVETTAFRGCFREAEAQAAFLRRIRSA